MGIKQEVRELDNGVPVLMMTYPDSKSVTIGVSFNVGGRNEWKRGDSYNGISHFLEHQFFKGNENLSPLEVHQLIDELGGITNAFTTKPVTAYFTKSLNSEIDNAIDLWSELLTFGEISQEEFDKEAFVVRQEFRRGEDNPVQYLFRNLGRELHKGTSLEMDVIGNEESLSSVTLQEMEDYRFEHYDLKNAVLMILGNFDKDSVYQKLNQTFGSRQVREEKPAYELTKYEPADETVINVYRYDKPSPLALLGLGIKTPGGQSKDYAALRIFSGYLSMGKSSLLQEKLVRSGLTAFAISFNNFYEDVGELLVIAGAPPPVTEQAHTAMMEMLHDALAMEVTEELLEEVCDKIEFSLRRTREEPIQVLFNQALGYWSRGKFMDLEETMELLRDVTVDQYNEMRQRVFGQLKGVYLMMGSVGEFHPSFPEDTWDGTFE